jgi:hypothetical protein
MESIWSLGLVRKVLTNLTVYMAVYLVLYRYKLELVSK